MKKISGKPARRPPPKKIAAMSESGFRDFIAHAKVRLGAHDQEDSPVIGKVKKPSDSSPRIMYYSSLRMTMLADRKPFKSDLALLDQCIKNLLKYSRSVDGEFEALPSEHEEFTRLCRAFQKKWKVMTVPMVNDDGEFLQMFVWDRYSPIPPTRLTSESMEMVSELVAMEPGRFALVDLNLPLEDIKVALREINPRKRSKGNQIFGFQIESDERFQELIERLKCDPKNKRELSEFVPDFLPGKTKARKELLVQIEKLEEFVAPTPGVEFP